MFVSGDPFIFALDKVQVKYEMLRTHLMDGVPVVSAAGEHRYSRAAFYLAAAAFEEDGMQGLLDEKRGRRGPLKVTPDINAYVQSAQHLSRFRRPSIATAVLPAQCALYPWIVWIATGRHVPLSGRWSSRQAESRPADLNHFLTNLEVTFSLGRLFSSDSNDPQSKSGDGARREAASGCGRCTSALAACEDGSSEPGRGSYVWLFTLIHCHPVRTRF